MSSVLGLDIGSSSLIAGILRGTKVLKESPRTFFKSRCTGQRVEVAPESLLDAVAKAISSIGEEAKNADCLAMAVMCPAWVAMDRSGAALTPIITHQDRRSAEEAAGIEARIGKSRHLKITGCRPFPGGISSTTRAWYLAHGSRIRRMPRSPGSTKRSSSGAGAKSSARLWASANPSSRRSSQPTGSRDRWEIPSHNRRHHAGARAAETRKALSPAQRPTARRSASFSGRPASRIAFWAAAMSYSSRRSVTLLAIVS